MMEGEGATEDPRERMNVKRSGGLQGGADRVWTSSNGEHADMKESVV